MRYLWFAVWMILAMFFAWVFPFMFLIDEPIARLLTWVYLVAVVGFGIAIGVQVLREFRSK